MSALALGEYEAMATYQAYRIGSDLDASGDALRAAWVEMSEAERAAWRAVSDFAVSYGVAKGKRMTEGLQAPDGAKAEAGQPPAALCRMLIVVGPVATSNGADHAPAIITRVWSPDMVNVMVFPDAITPRPATSVTVYADEAAAREAIASNRYANAAYWPPRV